MGTFKDEGGDRVVGWDSMCLCKGDERDGLWEVVDNIRVSVIVGGAGLLPEVPWDRWC